MARHEWDGTEALADRTYKLHYEKMVQDALRGVLREALTITARQGLPGAHHFYVTFRSRHPGVQLPAHLLHRHPEEMTIVLQNQFWGLEISEDWFEVTLSFNKVGERLRVPFSAVVSFADPSAKFGLQFTVDPSVERPLEVALEEEPFAEAGAPAAEGNRAKSGVEGDGAGKVITLDAFRKK